MLKYLAGLVVIAVACPAVEFEVASIRLAAPDEGRVNVGMHIDGSQVRLNFLSVRDCMRIAYEVKSYQIAGPDWIVSEHFDIAAKLPEGAGQDQVRPMLQKLLAERFRMTSHTEKREFSVYALVFGKSGLKLSETAAAEGEAAPSKSALDVKGTASAAGLYVDLGNGSYYTFTDNHLVGHKLPLWRIADMLGNFMDKPVVDMTGADRNVSYDLSFEITAEDYRTMQIRGALKSGIPLPPDVALMAEQPTESLTTALEAAGLRMESRKAPQDVIVIDSAVKTPLAN